jgi:iron complex transport system permease protein
MTTAQLLDVPARPDVDVEAGVERLKVWWVALAVLLLAACAIAGLLIGPAGLSMRGILTEIASHIPFLGVRSRLDGQSSTILWQLRAPRVVLGGIVGASLAMAGSAYQGAFRNPLADPYLLGVAAGAGLGATIVIVFHSQGTSSNLLPLAAFVGGLAAVAFTYGLGRSRVGDRSAASLLLAGVTIAAFLTAIETFFQQWKWESLQQVYSFILGGLAGAEWSQVWLVAPYVLVSSIALLLCSRRLDVLTVGDAEAESLGVNARRLRFVIVVSATILTASAVAVAGLIGFIGIIVPHAVRLMTHGASSRVLMPLAALAGAVFLIGCDLIAKSALAPAELPIGVVTAFFGAPFFLVVLRTSRGVA